MRTSKVFCMAPWIQLHAQTNGDVGPCCMANMDNGNAVSNLNVNPDISAAWNAPAMKQLRRNMLDGKKSSICLNCYEYEKVGKFSERMQYNWDFKRYFSRVLNTRSDGLVRETSIPVIDIRFSNRCNYKCRICSSEYSSLWHEDELRLNPEAKPYPKKLKVAADEEVFWNSFEKLLPDVKRLHFAGGEPLVMDEHYRTLQHLIDIGKTDFTLSYNTNFSTLRHKGYDLPDLWSRFDKVEIWASLDGMGAKGDYQRKGQHWPVIEDNIREMQRRCGNVLFGVNVTVNVFNVLHVPEFYRYMVKNGLVSPDRMNLYLLFYPYEFSITNLTEGLKSQVRENYSSFIADYLPTVGNSGHFSNHVQSIINRMDSEEGTLKHEFIQSVESLDRLRGENFLKIFPELKEMFA
jgi:MoaA/NifB/PqqE/SkfB family radical SAM enzyme